MRRCPGGAAPQSPSVESGGLLGACVPLLIGFVATGVGLATTMWILLFAPVVLLLLVPRD
jgi:hypothetical protein